MSDSCGNKSHQGFCEVVQDLEAYVRSVLVAVMVLVEALSVSGQHIIGVCARNNFVRITTRYWQGRTTLSVPKLPFSLWIVGWYTC